YNTPADDVAIDGTFSQCAEELGLTFSRERVPGDQLIQKVLQMGSSRTLPDLLMLDNPNVQQVAASGALAPLEQYGITTEGITDSVADPACTTEPSTASRPPSTPSPCSTTWRCSRTPGSSPRPPGRSCAAPRRR